MSEDIRERLMRFAEQDNVIWDAVYEIENLRTLLRQQELATEQWWFLASQYRNSLDHAGCVKGKRCRFCAMFHRNQQLYGPNPGE